MPLIYSKIPEENLKQRIVLLAKSKYDIETQQVLMRHCADDPLFFFNMFLWTYKPKAIGAEGEPEDPNIPFVTFIEFQDQFILDVISDIEAGRDNITEKSREMGYSWMLLGIALWGFLFKGWAGLIGSYKEDYVDESGNMDSSFERLRYMLARLPKWMKPHDLVSKYMSISSKTLGCEIAGDSGENFGTGGRRKYVWMDEFALWRADGKAFRKTSDVTNCRIFGGCITKDSMIIGENGIEEIGICESGYIEENKLVYGKGGFHKAVQRFGNGFVDTIKMTNNLGMQIEGTPNHRLLTPLGWKRLDELKEGDPLFVQSGQDHFGNKEEDLDFCYFLGLYLAEGTMEYRTINSGRDRDIPYRVTISHGDIENIEWMKYKYGFSCKDGMHSRLSSKTFMCRLTQYFEHKTAPDKILTPEILSLKKECLREVLRGYFDGDGHSLKSKRRVGCVTSSEVLSKQLQILLLNFGIVSNRSKHLSETTKKVNKRCIGYRVIMEGYEAYLYHRDIGFRLDRKDIQKNHQSDKNTRLYFFDKNDFGKIKGGSKYNGALYMKKKKFLSGLLLERVLQENPNEMYDMQLSYSYVKTLNNSQSETYDFVIPDTKQYFANGFIAHNTPEGKFNIYGKIMTNHPDYAHLNIRKYRLHWSKHPQKTQAWYEGQKAKRTRVDIAKELDISYDASVTGAVYPEYQNLVTIKKIDYDVNLRTYTIWDFGMDSNALIFVQKDFRTNQFYIIKSIRKVSWHIEKFLAFVKGEPTQGYTYTQDELDLIEWTKKTINGRYSNHFGDPYNGDAKQTNAVESVKDILARHGIYLTLRHGTTLESRITNASLALYRTFVNEGESDFNQSMIQSHYPQIKENSQATTAKTKPVHDENSHFRTTYEYWIDNEPAGDPYNPNDTVKVFVNKITGKQQTTQRTGFGLARR